jgi:hypothetical protein
MCLKLRYNGRHMTNADFLSSEKMTYRLERVKIFLNGKTNLYREKRLVA